MFNEVLSDLDQADLLDNESFEPDDLNNETYQKFWSTKDENYLDFMIEIFEDGVSFHIEKTDEIPEWSFKQIMNDSIEFKRIVKAVFNCKPVVQTQGKKSKIKFLLDDGSTEYEYAFYNGIGLNFLKAKETKELRKYFK